MEITCDWPLLDSESKNKLHVRQCKLVALRTWAWFWIVVRLVCYSTHLSSNCKAKPIVCWLFLSTLFDWLAARKFIFQSLKFSTERFYIILGESIVIKFKSKGGNAWERWRESEKERERESVYWFIVRVSKDTRHWKRLISVVQLSIQLSFGETLG